jgi:hypothetical protein
MTSLREIKGKIHDFTIPRDELGGIRDFPILLIERKICVFSCHELITDHYNKY